MRVDGYRLTAEEIEVRRAAMRAAVEAREAEGYGPSIVAATCMERDGDRAVRDLWLARYGVQRPPRPPEPSRSAAGRQ